MSILVSSLLFRLFKKLSADLKLNAVFFCFTGISLFSILLVVTFPPYVQLNLESSNVPKPLFSISSNPSTHSIGISSTNLDIALQLVEPKIVLLFEHVRNNSFFALVIPT